MRLPTRCAGSTRTRMSVRWRRCAQRGDGQREYLCKRYPAVFDLFLRGFAPAFLCRLFRRRLERYEMRDLMDVEPPRDVIGIPALSGAFMLVKRFAIDQHRRLRSEVLPVFRGLRLERALEPHHQDRVRAVGRDRPSRRARGAQGLPAYLLVRAQRLPLLSAARLEVVLMPMPAVVVTGANGFIGRACVRALAAARLAACAAWCARSIKLPPRARRVHRGRRSRARDRRPRAAQRAARRDGGRSPGGARASAARRERRCAAALRRINVDVSERIARAAAAVGVTHFVFASSVKVNGEATPPGRPLCESDPPDPHDDYAASKWEAERALATVAERHRYARDRAAPAADLRARREGQLRGAGARGAARAFRCRSRASATGAASLASATCGAALDVLLRSDDATERQAGSTPVSRWPTPNRCRRPISCAPWRDALRVAPRLFAAPAVLLRLGGACARRAASGRAPARYARSRHHGVSRALRLDAAAFRSTDGLAAAVRRHAAAIIDLSRETT